MAIRPTFRVGILLAVLYPFHVGSLSYKDCHYAGTSTQPGFVTGFGASLSEGYPGTNRRRRTRVDQTASGRIATAVSTAQARPPSSVVLQPAHAGSFAALPTRECCVGGSARERRRRSRMRGDREVVSLSFSSVLIPFLSSELQSRNGEPLTTARTACTTCESSAQQLRAST